MSIDTHVIVEIMNKCMALEAIYVFGSTANNSTTEDSDVDVAFLTDGVAVIADLKVFEIKQQLEVALGRDVDLINLHTASTVFQFQVVTTGVHFFVKNHTHLLNYEAMVLSQYQRLQEERKYILEEVISSGKVYS